MITNLEAFLTALNQEIQNEVETARAVLKAEENIVVQERFSKLQEQATLADLRDRERCKSVLQMSGFDPDAHCSEQNQKKLADLAKSDFRGQSFMPTVCPDAPRKRRIAPTRPSLLRRFSLEEEVVPSDKRNHSSSFSAVATAAATADRPPVDEVTSTFSQPCVPRR